MNIWWIIIVPLAFVWIAPMMAMHRSNASYWIFILFALFWGVVALFAAPMYDWGTNIGKRLGHTKIVALRERLKPKVLPPARVALVIMSIISLVFVIIEILTT